MPVIFKPVNAWVAAALAALFMVGSLAFMIESRAMILRSGAEVVLKVVPVDPRDLMRGDYVVLLYDISQIPAEQLDRGSEPGGRMLPVWVRLKPGPEGIHVFSGASLEKPVSLADGEVAILSKPGFIGLSTDPLGAPPPIYLTYGIERYYVPEGEGLVIEEARNAERTTVAVRVSDSGTGQISRLLIDGQSVYAEPLY